MIALNERIRLALLKEWVQSLYALRNLENVNARHRVLTPDEEAELSATAGHYTWIAQRYGKLRERLAEERGEGSEFQSAARGVFLLLPVRHCRTLPVVPPVALVAHAGRRAAA